MSLSDLMQKGWAKKVSSPAVAPTDVANQHGGIAGIATKPVASTQRDIASSPSSSSSVDHRSEWWRLLFHNGTRTEIRVVPAQNEAEIVSRHPDLKHAESFQKPVIVDEIPKRCETEKEASVYFLDQATSKASSLGIATATPAVSATDRLTSAEGVAEIARVAVANPQCDFAAHAAMEPVAEWWRLYFRDGSQREVREVPAQSLQGMLARYPDLKRIDSFDEESVWVGGSKPPETRGPFESASGYAPTQTNNSMAASQFWLNGLQAERLAIRHWLEQIGEQNPAVIEEIFLRCEADKKALAYCLEQARTMAVSLDVGTVVHAGALPSMVNSDVGFATATPATVATGRIAVEQPVAGIATVAAANHAAAIARAFKSLKKLHAEHVARIDGDRIARVRLSGWKDSMFLNDAQFMAVVLELESSGQIILEHSYARPNL